MKIPEYFSGAVQSIESVDPSVHRELGRAQSEFAQTVGSVGGEALETHYTKLSVSDKLAGEAELRARAQANSDFLSRNEYTPVEMLPVDLRDKRYIIEQEDGTKVIPTRQIADRFFERTMRDSVREISSKARTKLGKAWIKEDFDLDIMPQAQAQVAATTYQHEQRHQRVQVDEAVQKLLNINDIEGINKVVRQAELAGIIPSDEASQIVNDAANGIQYNSYMKLFKNPGADESMLVGSQDQIQNDPLLTAQQKDRLEGERRAAVYNLHQRAIDDAAVEGNVSRLSLARNFYSDPEYDGPLDGTERRRLVSSINAAENALKARAKSASDSVYFGLVLSVDDVQEPYEQTLQKIRSAVDSGTITGQQGKVLKDRLDDINPGPKDTAIELAHYKAQPELVATQEQLSAVIASNKDWTKNDVITLRQTHADYNKDPVSSARETDIIEQTLTANGLKKPSGKWNERTHAHWESMMEMARDEIADRKARGENLSRRELQQALNDMFVGQARLDINKILPDPYLSVTHPNNRKNANEYREARALLSDYGQSTTNVNISLTQRLMAEFEEQGVELTQQILRENLTRLRDERVRDAE